MRKGEAPSVSGGRLLQDNQGAVKISSKPELQNIVAIIFEAF